MKLEIDEMLESWGRWHVKATGFGYPDRSVEGRLMDDGGILPASTRGCVPLIYMPQDVEWVERAVIAVRQMPFGEPYVQALWRRYIFPLPTERQNAQALRVSERRYRELIARGRELVAVHLHAQFSALRKVNANDSALTC